MEVRDKKGNRRDGERGRSDGKGEGVEMEREVTEEGEREIQKRGKKEGEKDGKRSEERGGGK